MKKFKDGTDSGQIFTTVVPKIPLYEAVKINEAFVVNEGDPDEWLGESGDYLICINRTNYHICGADVYENTYKTK